VLATLLPRSPAAAHLAELERDTAAWTAFAPGWNALAFDEHYPGSAPTGCLSPDGPVAIPLDGGSVTLELSGGTSGVSCPIRDGSSGAAVSDAILDQGQTLTMTFDPPVRAFYTFHASLAVGAVVTMRLVSADGRIAGYDMVGDVSSTVALGIGHGFVSTVGIERVELSSSEAGATVIGAFVGLVGGEPSLGGAGACGGYTCDFGYAYATTLPADRLVTFDPDAFGDDFGRAVAVAGDLAVVGAPAHTGANGIGFGAAYVFRRVTAGPGALWALVKKLTPALAFSSSRFGASVAVDGDRIVVGAPRTPVGAVPRAGAAHVFERHAGGPEQWGETKRLLPLVAIDDGAFGTAVALEGELVLVGEPFATYGFLKPEEGSVAVHERNFGGVGAWGLRTILTQEFASSQFGAALALRDGLAIVGAPKSPIFSDAGPDVGVGHLYGRNQGGANAWGRLRRFFNAEPVDFAASVAVEGNVVAIGAPGDRPGELGGRIWIYEKSPADPWTVDPGLAEIVAAPDAAAGDRFGFALALTGNTLVASAPRPAAGTGSVYHVARIAEDSWAAAVLLPDPAPPGPLYGYALAFEGGAGQRLLVGSPLADAVFLPPASLVVFESGFETGDLSEWSQ
jgi:hypothetical protein